MTNPREQREAGTAATAGTQPEAIEDLEVTGDDVSAVAGGDGISFNYGQIKYEYTEQSK